MLRLLTERTAFFLQFRSLHLRRQQRRRVAVTNRRPDVAPERDPKQAAKHRERNSSTDEDRGFHSFFQPPETGFPPGLRRVVLIARAIDPRKPNPLILTSVENRLKPRPL